MAPVSPRKKKASTNTKSRSWSIDEITSYLGITAQDIEQNYKTSTEAAQHSTTQMMTPFRQPNDKRILQGDQVQKTRPIPELKRIISVPIANTEYRPSATERSRRSVKKPSAAFNESAQTEVSVNNNNSRTLQKPTSHQNLQHSVNSILRDHKSATSSISESNSFSQRYYNRHPVSGTLGDSRVPQDYYYPMTLNSTSILTPPYRTSGHIGVDPFSQRSIGNRGQLYTGAQRTQAVLPTTSKETLKRSNAAAPSIESSSSRFATPHYNSAMLNQKYEKRSNYNSTRPAISHYNSAILNQKVNNHYSGNLRGENFSLQNNHPSHPYNINDLRKDMVTHQIAHIGPRNTIIQENTAAPRSSPPAHQFHLNYLREAQAYGIAPHVQGLHYSGGSITADHAQNINTPRYIQKFSNSRTSSELPYNSQFSVDPRYSHVLTSPGSTRSTIGTKNINQEHHLQGVTKRPVKQKRSFSSTQSSYSICGMNLCNLQPKPISQNQITARIDLTDDRNILNKINALHISSSHSDLTGFNEYALKVLSPAEINLGRNRCTQQIKSNQTEPIVIFKNDLGIVISASQKHLKPANTLENMSSPSKTQVEANNNDNKNQKIVSSLAHISDLDHRTKPPIESNNIDVKCHERVNLSTDKHAEESIPAASIASENMSSSNNPQDQANNNNQKILLERMPMSPIEGNIDFNCPELMLPSTHKPATEQESSSSKLQTESFNKENTNTSENHSDTDNETISENSPKPANQPLAQETITEEEFMEELNSLINQLRSKLSATPVLLNRLCGVYARSMEIREPMRHDFSDNNNLEASDDTVSSTTSRDVPAEV